MVFRVIGLHRQFSVHSLPLYVLQFHNSKISLRLEMNLELNIGPLKANTGYQIDISYIVSRIIVILGFASIFYN
jgi:hypothetical protein